VKAADFLALARASNLPTVWTNVLSGVLLAGGTASDPRLPVLLLALSCCYVAGMFLNDACDLRFDREHRPDRPIPSGRVSLRLVAWSGALLLGCGVSLLAVTGFMTPAQGTGWRPLLAGCALAAAILAYDWHHKDNRWSPVIMGLCRLLTYVAAGWAISDSPPVELYFAGLLLLCYLVGLTCAAKQEHLATLTNLWPLALMAVPAGFALAGAVDGLPQALAAVLFIGWLLLALRRLRRRWPGDVPAAVSALLAGICLWDAVVLASLGESALAALAVFGFGLCLLLQRRIAAT
jgi:4-hydroxybenzoate polyprenyltransferase